MEQILVALRFCPQINRITLTEVCSREALLLWRLRLVWPDAFSHSLRLGVPVTQTRGLLLEQARQESPVGNEQASLRMFILLSRASLDD